MAIQKILLIDDDEDDQEIFLTALLKMANKVKCDTYTDAKEALERLKRKELTPDLIFLDLNMPVMNGQQFLLLIKMEPLIKDIPVIIFSTSSHQATKILMKELGAHDFITKPDQFDELVEVLKKTLV